MTSSRLLWQNFATFGGSIIAADSATISFPIRRIRDTLLSNRWRSASGWTIVAGFNNKIDFNRSGVKVATLTAGTYATGDAMAVAIVAALEAADSTPAWACSYSASTHKFTISADVSFVLLFGTGSNLAVSAGKDLGYAVSDTASATSAVAGLASYQSRHYITVDIGVAQDVKAMIVNSHNAGESGTFTVSADATSVAGALASPDYTTTLDSTENKDRIRAKVLSSAQTYRYWALVIDDVQNTDGYSEVANFYLGEWLELDLPARGLSKQPVDYSTLAFADQGAQYQDRKQRTRRWEYKFAVLTEAKVDEIDSAGTQLLTGGTFFFQRDPEADAGEIIYAFFTDLPRIDQSYGADQWGVTMSIQEALG